MSDLPIHPRPARSGRIAIAAAALLAVLGLSTQLPFAAYAHGLSEWFSAHGVLGLGAFFGIYVVWSLILPKSPLVILAGYVYGIQYGFALTYLAATATIIIGFLIARQWGRHHAQTWIANRPWLRACDHALGVHGGKVVTLLRLSPMIPFHLQNYLYGLSKLPLRTCVFASWLGMLPSMLIYLGIGAVAGSAGTFSADGRGMTLVIAGLLSTVVAAVIITRQARKYLRQCVLVEETALTERCDRDAA
jgi:uncharacterized membrane protein YdjX (TVP38/TMEM64 family)